MAILVLPTQIPKVWEQIKYAVRRVERLPDSDMQLYLNRLLQSLLDSKAQCFVRLDENRQLLAIAITRFTQDEVTGKKSLFVACLYSFQPVDQQQWQRDIDEIKQFAIKNECKKIITYSTNHRVFEIVESIGFSERFRCYSINLEES